MGHWDEQCFRGDCDGDELNGMGWADTIDFIATERAVARPTLASAVLTAVRCWLGWILAPFARLLRA